MASNWQGPRNWEQVRAEAVNDGLIDPERVAALQAENDRLIARAKLHAKTASVLAWPLIIGAVIFMWSRFGFVATTLTAVALVAIGTERRQRRQAR
jgi:hypothetical protein